MLAAQARTEPRVVARQVMPASTMCAMSHDLIDTAEMYLRTIYELLEEGIVPMRARIAERLGQSNPTVSQTVARLERDGLLTVVADDRHLELTPAGHATAVAVMRKHQERTNNLHSRRDS